MAERTLHGCRILVVEDEYLLADELRAELEEAGAVVLGPVGVLADALALIRSGTQIDGAILDLNLGGDMSYPAADLLVERGVPFMVTSGYDRSVIPERFAHVARCEKPINVRRVTAAIGRLIGD